MSQHSTVLAIELSTSRGSVAVVRGCDVLFESAFASQRSHNSQLFEPLRSALTAAGNDLDRIVIGLGPGSYTGVRIAIAAAQGISMTRGIPALGLPSLLCPDTLPASAPFAVIGDARRDGFFAATISDDRVTEEGIQILTSEELKKWLSQNEHLPIYTYDSKMAEISPAILTHPSAVALASLGQKVSPDPDVQTLEPIYLRDAFITEAKRPWTRI